MQLTYIFFFHGMNMIIINVSLAFIDQKYPLIKQKRKRIIFDLHRTHLLLISSVNVLNKWNRCSNFIFVYKMLKLHSTREEARSISSCLCNLLYFSGGKLNRGLQVMCLEFLGANHDNRLSIHFALFVKIQWAA